MKNAIKILVLIMLTASMSSCDWIKGIADVEIDTNIEGNLEVVTDEADLKSTDAHRFDKESNPIDVINDDLSEYEDLIDDFKTQTITLTVEAVDSVGAEGVLTPITGVELLNGTAFGISNSNGGYTWTLNSDWPIEEGFTLALDAASYDVIDGMLLEQLPITLTANGTCNKGNIRFELNYNIEAIVVANPIE